LHVIFEEDGPGCIYNFWFTGSGRNLHWGKLRFYFDGEKTPRIECDAGEFFNGLHKPFVYPLVTHNDTPANYSSLVYYYILELREFTAKRNLFQRKSLKRGGSYVTYASQNISTNLEIAENGDMLSY
jgi:hypothetical protein